MPIILWGVLAVAAGALVIWIVALKSRPTHPPLPPGTEFPATTLQKVARWSMGIGALLGLAAAAVVVMNGPQKTFDDDTIRLTFTFLLLAVLGVFSTANVWLGVHLKREDGVVDERDKAILERAPATQSLATLLTLAVWTLALSMYFHDAGAVPVFYLYLVFWSCLVMNTLGLPMGILVGYRRR